MVWQGSVALMDSKIKLRLHMVRSEFLHDGNLFAKSIEQKQLMSGA